MAKWNFGKVNLKIMLISDHSFSMDQWQPFSTRQGHPVILLVGLWQGSFAVVCRFNTSFSFPILPSLWWVLGFCKYSNAWLQCSCGYPLYNARTVTWLHQPVRHQLVSSSTGDKFNYMYFSCFFRKLDVFWCLVFNLHLFFARPSCGMIPLNWIQRTCAAWLVNNLR